MAGRRGEPIAPDRIRVEPATAATWKDVEILLGSGGERGCWCQSWRGSDSADVRAFGKSAPWANRLALQAQVRDGAFAPGVIAYVESAPVGWCGLGPRASMPRLMRSRTIPLIDEVAVWSIGCFVVRTGFRRRGVARALLAGAIEYARSMGAPAIEAYPIDPGDQRVSTSFGFVGFAPMFRAAGFRFVAETDARSAGLPRQLMRLDLE